MRRVAPRWPFVRRLALENGDQRILDIEAWCRRWFGIQAEKSLVLQVQVGAVASPGGGDIQRLAGHGVVDEDVGASAIQVSAVCLSRWRTGCSDQEWAAKVPQTAQLVRCRLQGLEQRHRLPDTWKPVDLLRDAARPDDGGSVSQGVAHALMNVRAGASRCVADQAPGVIEV